MRISASSERQQRKSLTLLNDFLELALTNTVAEKNDSLGERGFLLDTGLDLVINVHTQAMLDRAFISTKNK